ncbi:asparaginyl-tRNA synthetase [Thecamonas trahens ATCC 50062]|uniref:asparagine--tRNA ligase n=1 Tax=Thecamonas trahens ATCC 50062 TaxID=461836 RepID=A0A0L0D6V2_THETB|nr:asparaginyl-tRNA synthetase [Thecamonas trahens ATCC 50062]KNC47831.1 asparaginyl-tRNA synthetase [Thecamonas trahens ATCC 50062]|eukprot:XP_013759309.1 asparaginyl-tRNA synthetase [Thecamonas trahens ATCC 50062]
MPPAAPMLTMATTINALMQEALGEGEGGAGRQSGVHVAGWVKSVRRQKHIAFVMIDDGTWSKPLQVVVKGEAAADLPDNLQVGDAVRASGDLVGSKGGGQAFELVAKSLAPLPGSPTADSGHGKSYPLQKKAHSQGFLRSLPHLRARTSHFAATMRVRSRLARALQVSAEDHLGCIRVQTPVITAGDCEGAGERFAVAPEGTAPGDAAAFFGAPTFLSVSGQLEAEALGSGLGNVYTFGPTFRAENSNTSRHLAEFWMLEPELYFIDSLDTLLHAATTLVTAAVGEVLDDARAAADLSLLDPDFELRLSRLVTPGAPWAAIEYTDAIAELRAAVEAGAAKFAQEPVWGMDLSTEHEQFVVARLNPGRPTFIVNYPASIKPFYMKANPRKPGISADGDTVAAFDLLLPDVGEVMGGSMREDNAELLERAMVAKSMDPALYEWYLDLRRFGSAPHGGFGLGFDRLLQYVTRTPSIRDVVAFPRGPAYFASHPV